MTDIAVSIPDAVARLQRCSPAWLAALLKASRDGILIEAGGVIALANEPCARMLGYTGPDELIGQEVSVLCAASNEGTLQGLRAPHPPGEALEFFRFAARRKDHSLIELEASLEMAEVGGEPHTVVVLRDPTARANLEAQLRQAQKMEAVGQLANGVAHDFNNLLTAIRCQTETILAYETLTPEAKEMLQQVVQATGRASNLTRQLLAFSRRQPMQPTTVDLHSLTGNMSKMLQRLIGEQIQLRLDLAPELPLVFADPSMIEQVLMNLAVNARDAMPRGGCLSLSTRVVLVDADYLNAKPAAKLGEAVALTVSDTGTGIPAEVLPRIFEPFFTTKGTGKGSGLGLATVFGIVQQHQGWIEVESRTDIGTTFRVCLPARRDLKPISANATELSSAPTGNEGLLVVEDDRELRKMIGVALTRLGYQVFDAASVEETLQVWREHSGEIKAVLADAVLADDLNGWELAEKLRAEKPSLGVVLMSGYGHQMAEEQATPRPGIRFISKPFDPKSLALEVRAVIDEKG